MAATKTKLANPNAKLGWVHWSDGLQTAEIEGGDEIGVMGGRTKVRLRFRQGKQIVVGRLESISSNRIYPNVKAARAAVTKKLKAEIRETQRQIKAVERFVPRQVR